MPQMIAVCQFEPVVGAIGANVLTVRELAMECPEDVELAVFPELCVTGYDLSFAVDAATPVPGPLTDRLADVAADADLTLVVGLPEHNGDAVYNDLVCLSPSGVECRYRKQYLWGDEADAFETGTGPVTVETPIGTVGFLLCYDLNLPEAALAYARRDVDVLAVSAAWRESYRRDWKLLLRARALDGTCYAVGSNHAGDQAGRLHAGGSLIAGPEGTVLECVTDGVELASARIDPDAIAAARQRNPVAITRSKSE